MTKLSKNTELQQSCITAVMSSFFKTCYRIVDDNYRGYEVQIKRWYCPFYIQKEKYGVINTFSSIEEAKEWINKGCPKDVELKCGNVIYWQNCS